ncbi:MAG TPA: hypothetical protein VEG60_29905 [Candidatus Binatia bacterium]|nr:hypothetical protein [Candidatus Binatia bacterium]
MNEKAKNLLATLEAITPDDLRGISQDDANMIEGELVNVATKIALAGVYGEDDRKNAEKLLAELASVKRDVLN